jgi:hypothetical protein
MKITILLKGSSGHLKLLGCLALGYPLSLQIEIVLEQIGPLKSVPELMAVEIVAVWKIDYSAHGYLSLQAIAQ